LPSLDPPGRMQEAIGLRALILGHSLEFGVWSLSLSSYPLLLRHRVQDAVMQDLLDAHECLVGRLKGAPAHHGGAFHAAAALVAREDHAPVAIVELRETLPERRLHGADLLRHRCRRVG